MSVLKYNFFIKIDKKYFFVSLYRKKKEKLLFDRCKQTETQLLNLQAMHNN